WSTSDTYGFVRSCELRNLADSSARIDMVDGLQNILPCSPKKRNSLLGGILIVLALLGAAMVRLT
ncbi:MAG: hypothetical protein ACPGNT_09400, partial [Rhodospirillales bacterium]